MLKDCFLRARHIFCLTLLVLMSVGGWHSAKAQVSIEQVQHLVNTKQLDSAGKYANQGIEYIQQNDLYQPENLIYFSTVLLWADMHREALSTLLILSEYPDLTNNQRATVHAKLGELFMEIKSFQLSNENFKKTLKFYESNQVARYYWYGDIGRNFIDLGHEDSARLYFTKQLRWAASYDSIHEVALARNNIGFAFVKEEKLDSGVYYYQQAIEDLLSEEMNAYDLTLYSNLQINVGKLFYQKGQIKASQVYLEEAYKVARQNGGAELTLEAGLALFQTFMARTRYSDGKKLLTELEAINEVTPEQQYELVRGRLLIGLNDPETPLKEEVVLNFTNAVQNQLTGFQKAAETNVELTSNYLIKLATVENKLNRSLIEQANAQLKVEQQRKQNLMLWFVLGGTLLLLASFGVYFYNNNKRKQSRLRAELLEKDKEKLQYELKLKEQDLTNFAITLNIKKEQNQELLTMLEKLKKNKDPGALKSGVDELIRELKGKMNTEKTLDKFEQNFELVNAKFFDQLTARFPNLTRYEREFCAMIRLDLNNKEIASLKGISLNSAKVSKYRLKKKLELGEDEDIALYLQKI